eukprot:5742944-Amphidinium_carterae.1
MLLLVGLCVCGGECLTLEDVQHWQGVLHYWPSEADTPQKIRRSISSPPHYGGERRALML